MANSGEMLYIRIPSELKAELEAEAEREARTISAQAGEIFRERYWPNGRPIKDQQAVS